MVLEMRGLDFYLQCSLRHCILGRGNQVSIWSVCLNRELISLGQTNSFSPDGEKCFFVFKVRKRQQASDLYCLKFRPYFCFTSHLSFLFAKWLVMS